jgi:outer membrane protein TolC
MNNWAMSNWARKNALRLLLTTALFLPLSACQSGLNGGTTRIDATAEQAALADGIPDRLPTALTSLQSGIRPESLSALYADPLLTGYLDRAVAANTDIATARIRLTAAEARLRQARARRSLSLSTSGALVLATGIEDIDLTDSGSLGLSAAYDPDLFGGLRAGLRSADARRAIQDAEFARLQRIIQTRTAQSYIAAVAAEAQLALAQENFDFLGETLRVSRARFDAGDIARADFALSEAEYENSRAALAAQTLSARETRRALATLLNEFADEDLMLAPDLPVTNGLTMSLQSQADQAVLSRFDVEAARLAVVAAAADVDAVRASTLPSISLSGGLSGGLSIGDLFDIDTYISRLSASIADTIFDGGGEAARLDEAKTAIDLALINYEVNARDAYRELTSSFDQVEVSAARVTALQAASVAAERALELETIRFDLGEAILLDVLTVQRRVNSILSARISAEAAYLQALAEADLAAGPVR